MGGVNEADFIRAFTLALSDDNIIQKPVSVICGSLRHDISGLDESNKLLSSELKEFQDTNRQLQKEVYELRDIVQKKDKMITSLEDKLVLFKTKLDEHEQYTRRNSLRISGIKETGNEDVGAKVLDLCNKQLGVKITSAKIDRVHSVGPPRQKQSRPVLVKFTTYHARQVVFKLPGEPGQFYLWQGRGQGS